MTEVFQALVLIDLIVIPFLLSMIAWNIDKRRKDDD